MSTTGLTFTFDEHQHPVSAKCPFCGEEMPPPTPGLVAPLSVILWGTEQLLKHESLKHPELRSLTSAIENGPQAAMKTYVLAYKVDVDFGAQPNNLSRYPVRGLAEDTCRKLNLFGLHSGNHFCSFTVDVLPEGDFGIICVCHPSAHFGPVSAVLHTPNDECKMA